MFPLLDNVEYSNAAVNLNVESDLELTICNHTTPFSDAWVSLMSKAFKSSLIHTAVALNVGHMVVLIISVPHKQSQSLLTWSVC